MEYEQQNVLKTKSIDLLDLKPSTNVQEVVDEIAKKEPLITSSRKEQVAQLVQSNL